MLKHVAYIGFGFVGQACHHVFRDNSQAIIIDPARDIHTYEHIRERDPPLTFVSVPAPTRDDGSVDASEIYTIFEQLRSIRYTGIIVVKSTIPPEIARDLFNQYMDLEYVYSPEFLREAHWEKDATHPNIIVLGGGMQNTTKVEQFYIKNSTVWDAVSYHHTNYEQASMMKYALNSYLAMKVVFMNQLKAVFLEQVHNPGTAEWDRFVKMISMDVRLGRTHLQVPGPDGKAGYGGSCFPKDVNAFLGIDKNDHLTLLKEASIVNTKLRLINDGTNSN